jgi:hypothetical protein
MSFLTRTRVDLGKAQTVTIESGRKDAQRDGSHFLIFGVNNIAELIRCVSHCVGLRVYDPGSIPSLTHSRLVRTRLSAHNASRRRYRSQFP